jgi:hypothetical protein
MPGAEYVPYEQGTRELGRNLETALVAMASCLLSLDVHRCLLACWACCIEAVLWSWELRVQHIRKTV